jgi:uracil phosphoribosyltransferase
VPDHSNLFISQHPAVLHKLALLRDETTEPKKFRELVREISWLVGYEALADARVDEIAVRTPLEQTVGHELAERIGLVPILRAGLGMVEGVWKMLPQAEVWHLGLYRDEATLQPVEYYNKLPVAPTVQLCLILDPMLATGGSAIAAVNVLKDWGVNRIKFVGILAAPEGIQALQDVHPDVPIHVAAIDERLTPAPADPDDPHAIPRGFIWPGLGDAGDRLFGTA